MYEYDDSPPTCDVIPANDKVVQTRTLTDGRMICGRYGGYPYLNATLVDEEGNCPSDMVSCSNRNTDSYCYTKSQAKKYCPIIGLSYKPSSSGPIDGDSYFFNSNLTYVENSDMEYYYNQYYDITTTQYLYYYKSDPYDTYWYGENDMASEPPLVSFGSDWSNRYDYNSAIHLPQQCLNSEDVNYSTAEILYPLEAVLYGCNPVMLDDEEIYFDERFTSITNLNNPTMLDIQ
jgi:hypothetical protein